MCWFVGEVYFYFSHTQQGQTHFLALVNVMHEHRINHRHIPFVKKSHEYTHFAVINVQSIKRCVGLVRYSSDQTEFKVTWQYARYDEQMDGRYVGRYNYL